MQVSQEKPTKLSIVVPCFNEEKTLELCLQHVLEIQDESLSLEIIIVDDCSTDNSLKIAETLSL
jgi:glycosyltransferase involved in cell wall biosynthesis